MLGGLFGIGGGLVIVPALVLIWGLDLKTATGTSLFALVWPVGILGVLEYYKRGQMRITHGSLIAVGLLFGILVGAKLTAPLSRTTMQRLYGTFLVTVGLYYLVGIPYFSKVAAQGTVETRKSRNRSGDRSRADSSDRR